MPADEIMHKWAEGVLKDRYGNKIKKKKQAIAIAMSYADKKEKK